jgi:O-methyltransferase
VHPFTQKKIAKLVWPKYSRNMDVVNRNAEMLDFLNEQTQQHAVPAFPHRFDLYSAVNDQLGNQAICYLEFGVWRGESLRKWTQIHSNPGSRFYGFDSFEGLPEDWQHVGATTTKAAFDLNGNLPIFDDARVGLVKGWFQHTIGPFLREHPITHPLVIHNDSDLHSSTLYTLAMLDSYIQPGDIIIFDEYNSPLNEYLAWKEYQKAFMRTSKCIGMSNNWTQAAFMFA